MNRQRCAVYTRKSTEDGLEQAFNSLDAQREACEAYVASQRHEGWTLIKQSYDDGGFSGGSMQRPGLQSLLADVEAGHIDVIIVYKVDRLTRSLADFAKIVEILDAKGASFVSVTQAFNTTTSMGRLTLNVLLSFAQFEREVTGERIRDKIAASKKKGIWMGGPVPLGYRVDNRKLVTVPEEAERVRRIMRCYLASPSADAVVAQLKAEGVLTKVQHRTSGPSRGGIPFARGSLYHLLKNRIYRGMTMHKGTAYPGEHEAIVDEPLWEAVQEKLKSKAAPRGAETNARQPALLRGRLFDQHGRQMQLSHTKKGSVRYRYYVSRREHGDPQQAARVSTEKLERTAISIIAAWLGSPGPAEAGTSAQGNGLEELLAAAGAMGEQLKTGDNQAELLGQLVKRAVLNVGDLELEIRLSALSGCRDDERTVITSAPVLGKRWTREPRRVVSADVPLSANVDPALTALLAEARSVQKAAYASGNLSLSAMAAAEGMSRRQFTRLLRLSYLSPRIVERVISGAPMPAMMRTELVNMELPLAWPEQEALLGLR